MSWKMKAIVAAMDEGSWTAFNRLQIDLIWGSHRRMPRVVSMCCSVTLSVRQSGHCNIRFPKVLTYCRCLIHQPSVDTARSFCSLYCGWQGRGGGKKTKALLMHACVNMLHCHTIPLGGRIIQSMEADCFPACATNDPCVSELKWMDATARGGARLLLLLLLLLLHALLTPIYIYIYIYKIESCFSIYAYTQLWHIYDVIYINIMS